MNFGKTLLLEQCNIGFVFLIKKIIKLAIEGNEVFSKG